MIQIDLSDKTILITGALGAISECMVRRLLEGGATLLLTGRASEQEGAERLAAWNLPEGNYVYRRMDVTNPREVTAVVSGLFNEYPKLDTVLAHAGGCGLHPFETTPQEEYDRIFHFNYHSHTYVARAVLAEWVKRSTQGHLIFTSSLVGSLPMPDITAYIPAKAALEAFSKVLALEYADRGIRFNVVAPGHVAAGSALKVYKEDVGYRTMVDRVIPMKRLIRPEAIADAFVWLVSHMADDVNGQVIKVDLGTSIPKVG